MQILRRVELWLHVLAWRGTKAAKAGTHRPELIALPGDNASRRDTLELNQKLAARQERRKAELAQIAARRTDPRAIEPSRVDRAGGEHG